MRALPRITVAAAAVALSAVAWIPWHPAPSTAQVRAAGSDLAFTRAGLPTAATDQKVRPVAPGLRRIDRWISSVGASVGSADLRGTGRDGDGCLTDPRDDQIRVFPIPGSSGPAYPAFQLRATGLRYDATMAPMGCVPSDVDQDGRTDVVVYYWGRSPIIFRNVSRAGQALSAASFRPTELVTPMQVWNTTALNVADVDGDGRLDILVGNYFPDGARVLDPTASDDALMQMQHSMGQARNAGVNRLFMGRPAGADGTLRFDDDSNRIPAESAHSWTLAFGAQDLTGDGRPEFYVANDFGPDQLLVNRSRPGNVSLAVVKGTRDLTTPKSKVLGHDSFKGMGVTYSYEPGSAMPRIFVSNITAPWGLQESNLAFVPDAAGVELLKKEMPYADHSTAYGLAHSGWSWDIKAVDLTNSGHDDLVQATGFIQGTKNFWPRLQELAMGNDQILQNPSFWPPIKADSDLSGHERAKMWVPEGDRFVDVGKQAGFSSDDVTRGISVTDVNGDCLMDFTMATQWGDSYVYLNHSRPAGAGVCLRVVHQVAGNAPTALVGAQVTLLGAGPGRTSQLYPANGHSGVSGSLIHFGLGTSRAEGLTARVQWTDAAGRHSTTVPVHTGYQEVKVTP